MAPPTKDNAGRKFLIKNENIMMLAISKQKTIDNVVANFFIKTLPTISGEPDYESLNEIIQALYANSVTLPTTLAGVKHGHIGLIMKDTIYATLASGTLW